jgi:hypothetical protein
MTDTRRRRAWAAVLVALVAAVWWNGRAGTAALAQQSHSALCEFRNDLSRRYEDNVELLHKHPEDPVMAYGLTIPRAILVTNTDAQKSTLDNLDKGGLEC